MKANIVLTNAGEIQETLRRGGKAARKVALRVLSRACQRVVPKAQAAAPEDVEDGGDLRSSIRETKPVITASGRVSAGVVAGGLVLERLASERGHKLPGLYVIKQHFDLTLRHRTGGAMFIARPFMAEAERVPDQLEREMDMEAQLGGS